MAAAEQLASLRAEIDAALRAQATALGVAGAVVGVAVGDTDVTVAHGLANLATGQELTPDTGFLLGSVTKVLTATALMRLVDRGQVDLDAPALRYVPEFALSDPEAAAAITVRMLLNHTNGIDADALMPSPVRGRDASKSFTAKLSRLGVLFDPGTCLHYGNAGFVLAARVIEERTGLPYERALDEEIFAPCGMRDATAVQSQALLRRTAVGAMVDPQTGGLTVPKVFSYPESAAGAGSTPIVSAADMLAFGRAQLHDAAHAAGPRLLTTDSAQAMRTATVDLGLPQAPPMGLGWWLVPICGTTALWHGGGSPGGVSSFCVLPDFDAVVVCFASGPGAGAMTDLVMRTALEHLTGQAPQAPVELGAGSIPDELEGTYQSFQNRVTVQRAQGELVLGTTYEPMFDDDHRRTWSRLAGDSPSPPTTYVPVAEDQFAPKGVDPASLAGFFGRLQLLTHLPPAAGRRAGLHTSLRFTPKVTEPETARTG